jgi:hypothetical protein
VDLFFLGQLPALIGQDVRSHGNSWKCTKWSGFFFSV